MIDTRDCFTVTVVIPCFNQARFLPAAVASVRAQRYPHVDCIVVNDGSTDDTAAVAEKLGVRLLEQINSGVSEARNAGLAAARSGFVVFLDADDELLPDAVAAGAGTLGADPSAAAVVGRCQVMDGAGHQLPAFHSRIDASNLYQEWLSRNFVWTPGAAMFRKQALDEIGGFPAGLGPAADYAVYLRLARTDGVRLIPRDLVRYRQHATSMSRDPAMMLHATLEVLRRERRGATPVLRRQIDRGRLAWSDWYGEKIVGRLRTAWHAGRRGGAQMRAALLVVRRCPRIALRHVARKARLVLASIWRRATTAVGQLPMIRRRRVTS
jgi:glycosyltransferase involved in cell wall biosynthesis